MKRVLMLVIGCFCALTFSLNTSAQYFLTPKDNEKVVAVTKKIENAIKLKGDKYRQKYIDALSRLYYANTDNERLSMLLLSVLSNINNNTSPIEIGLANRPTADLFVMSYCPFGLQAEKAFIPLIEKFKPYADLKIRFVQYTMHGFKEAQENTTQYCIQKEQNEKFIPYLNCFIKDGDSKKCLGQVKIDVDKLGLCYAETMKQLGGEDKFNLKGYNTPEYNLDKSDALSGGVQGSPTLVINKIIQHPESERTQAGYARIICDSFTKEKRPKICDEKFSETLYQPGFGMETEDNASVPSNCGN